MELKENTLKILLNQVQSCSCVGYDQYNPLKDKNKFLYIDKVLNNGTKLLMDNGRAYFLDSVEGIDENGNRVEEDFFQMIYFPEEQRGDHDVLILEYDENKCFVWIHGS